LELFLPSFHCISFTHVSELSAKGSSESISKNKLRKHFNSCVFTFRHNTQRNIPGSATLSFRYIQPLACINQLPFRINHRQSPLILCFPFHIVHVNSACDPRHSEFSHLATADLLTRSPFVKLALTNNTNPNIFFGLFLCS